MKNLMIVCIALLSTVAWAATNQTASVLDGAGGRSAGGSYSNIQAVAQPGGIQESVGGSYIHQAGFLNSFMLRGSLDTDGDGLADELDRDNDADGLADRSEIEGSPFSPATATDPLLTDTDADGADDAHEAAAGTNPQDNSSLLQILTAQPGTANNMAVTWQSRNGYEYELLSQASMLSPGSISTVAVLTASGGVSPWFKTSSTATGVTVSSETFYHVKVRP